MDFEPLPEHQAFRKVVHEFAAAEIAPHAVSVVIEDRGNPGYVTG